MPEVQGSSLRAGCAVPSTRSEAASGGGGTVALFLRREEFQNGHPAGGKDPGTRSEASGLWDG